MGKRNPNGYGCVTRLSGKRSRPWVIKVTIYNSDGSTKQVPIDYAETEKQTNIILAKYNNNPWSIDRNKVTLVDLYQHWEKIKMPKPGNSLQATLRAAFKHCSRYYGMKYRSIRAYHMQECIDNCGLSRSMQGAIKNLWGALTALLLNVISLKKCILHSLQRRQFRKQIERRLLQSKLLHYGILRTNHG